MDNLFEDWKILFLRQPKNRFFFRNFLAIVANESFFYNLVLFLLSNHHLFFENFQYLIIDHIPFVKDQKIKNKCWRIIPLYYKYEFLVQCTLDDELDLFDDVTFAEDEILLIYLVNYLYDLEMEFKKNPTSVELWFMKEVETLEKSYKGLFQEILEVPSLVHKINKDNFDRLSKECNFTYELLDYSFMTVKQIKNAIKKEGKNRNYQRMDYYLSKLDILRHRRIIDEDDFQKFLEQRVPYATDYEYFAYLVKYIDVGKQLQEVDENSKLLLKTIKMNNAALGRPHIRILGRESNIYKSMKRNVYVDETTTDVILGKPSDEGQLYLLSGDISVTDRKLKEFQAKYSEYRIRPDMLRCLVDNSMIDLILGPGGEAMVYSVSENNAQNLAYEIDISEEDETKNIEFASKSSDTVLVIYMNSEIPEKVPECRMIYTEMSEKDDPFDIVIYDNVIHIIAREPGGDAKETKKVLVICKESFEVDQNTFVIICDRQMHKVTTSDYEKIEEPTLLKRALICDQYDPFALYLLDDVVAEENRKKHMYIKNQAVHAGLNHFQGAIYQSDTLEVLNTELGKLLPQ